MVESSIKNWYAFILGREKELCLNELKALLKRFDFCFSDLSVSDNVAFINIDKDEQDIRSIFSDFAGTTKIFKIISDNVNSPKSVVESYISANTKKSGKFNFGLSSYTPKFDQRRVNSLGLLIKKDLKSRFSLRYIDLRQGKEVSTILSFKNKLVDDGFEFAIFNQSIGVLVAATNPEEWSSRDYDKPACDKKSGMLPPKLARMMVNIALGPISETAPISSRRDILIVDPFCGSGNVLMESSLLGFDVFGSDISEKATRDSQTNLDWLGVSINNKRTILTLDATSPELIKNLEQTSLSYKNIAFVSEPYLGEPKRFKQTLNAAIGEYKKVGEIYSQFLKNISLLSKKSKRKHVLCLVFPLVETLEGKLYSLYQDSVDEIRKIGYTELQSPLTYGRDYQVVKREVVLLQL